MGRDEILRAGQQVVSRQRFISFLAVLLFPAVLSIWVDKAGPDKVGALLFWGVIAAIILIQTRVFFLLDQKPEETAPGLFFEYHKLKSVEGALETKIIANESVVQSLTSAVVLSRAWSSFQAQLPVVFSNANTDLAASCQKVIDPLIGSLGSIFNVSYDDLWSVTVYRWSEADELLRPVFWNRARAHPSDGEPRSWRDGEGHSGTAFMAQQVLFTSDLAEPQTLNRVLPRPGNARDYDLRVYRSFVTVPLTIDDEHGVAHRLGVVALTSDQSGRFDETNVYVVEQLGSVLSEALWLDQIAKSKQAS